MDKTELQSLSLLHEISLSFFIISKILIDVNDVFFLFCWLIMEVEDHFAVSSPFQWTAKQIIPLHFLPLSTEINRFASHLSGLHWFSNSFDCLCL